MARTEIPIQVIPYQGSLTDISLTAGDAANDHYFDNNGWTLLFIANDDTAAKTVTVKSVSDEYGRTGDETIVIAADNLAIAGPFRPGIWNQDGGTVNVDITDDTNLSFAAIKIVPGR